MNWSPKSRLFWPVVLALLIADCTTKQLAEYYLPEHTPLEILGSVLRLTLAHNPDGAMSLSLGRYSRVGFSIAACLALTVLAGFYRAARPQDRLRVTALALLAGGAMGNLLNRLLSPAGVVDFIDVGVEAWRFWTFNVADAGITAGAVMLAYVVARSPGLTED